MCRIVFQVITYFSEGVAVSIFILQVSRTNWADGKVHFCQLVSGTGADITLSVTMENGVYKYAYFRARTQETITRGSTCVVLTETSFRSFTIFTYTIKLGAGVSLESLVKENVV
jgi:hypothetical protein